MTARTVATLWGTLQAHRVMQDYNRAAFRDHPKVQPMLIRHLFSSRLPVTVGDEIRAIAKQAKMVADKTATECTKLIAGKKRKGGPGKQAENDEE